MRLIKCAQKGCEETNLLSDRFSIARAVEGGWTVLRSYKITAYFCTHHPTGHQKMADLGGTVAMVPGMIEYADAG